VRIDASEALRELASAAGGEAQLESRLKQIQIPEEAGDSKARVIALVDEQGKVLEAQPGDAKDPASLGL